MAKPLSQTATHKKISDTVPLSAVKATIRQNLDTFGEILEADENIDHYLVFRKEGSVDDANALYNYIGKTKVKSFVDFEAKPGRQYWYAIVAVDKAGNPSCPGFPKAGFSIGLRPIDDEVMPFEIVPDSGLYRINGKMYRKGEKIPIISGYTVEIPRPEYVEIQHRRVVVPDASDVDEKVFDEDMQTFTFKTAKGAFIWKEKRVDDSTEVRATLPAVVKTRIRFASEGYKVELQYRKKGADEWQTAPMQRGKFEEYDGKPVSEADTAQPNAIKVTQIDATVGDELEVKPVGLDVKDNIEFAFRVEKPNDRRYVGQFQVYAHVLYDELPKRQRDPAQKDTFLKFEMRYDEEKSRSGNTHVFSVHKGEWSEIKKKADEGIDVNMKIVFTVNFAGLKNQFTSKMYLWNLKGS